MTRLFGQVLLLTAQLLGALLRSGLIGVLSKLFCLVGHLALLLLELLYLVVGFRQFLLRVSGLRILQHLARPIQLFQRLLCGLRLGLRVATLRLALHVLRSLLHLPCDVGHLPIVVFA